MDALYELDAEVDTELGLGIEGEGSDFEGDHELGEDWEDFEIDGFDDGELFEATEGDFEDAEDYEADLFLKKAFRGLGRLIKRGARFLARKIPLFRMLAPIAARIVGGAIGGPAGVALAGAITNAVLKEDEPESEGEYEAELLEGDFDFEALGGNMSDALEAEDLVAMIAETESESEADQMTLSLARRLARMSRRILRRKPALRRYHGRLIRAALALVKTLRANRRTRGAVRFVPIIYRRTLARLARARQITKRLMVRIMAEETARALRSRTTVKAGLKRHHALRRAARRRRRRRPRIVARRR